ncbi:MAG: hypothetical protein ACRCW9_10025 [Cetobacterium sp.]
MNSLKEIITNEQMYEKYMSTLVKIDDILNKRKKLFEINSVLDVDLCIEKMHEAKMNLDYCLKIIEYLKIERTEALNIDKENLKFKKIECDVMFSETQKQLKEDLSARDFDKKKEWFIVRKIKQDVSDIDSDSTDLSIINFELNSLIRLRENIEDIYLSLKKKYDSLIKLKV